MNIPRKRRYPLAPIGLRRIRAVDAVFTYVDAFPDDPEVVKFKAALAEIRTINWQELVL